jgi:hypothetical protein
MTERTDLPSTRTMERAIEKGKEIVDKAEEVAPPGPKASTIAKDVKNVLEDTQTLLREKNKGEKLQKIMTYGRQINQSGQLTQQGKEIVGTVKDQSQGMKQEGNELLNSMRSLTWELVTSPEFRESILDFVNLLQSVVWNIRDRQASEQVYPPPSQAAKMEWNYGSTSFPMTQESIKEATRQIGDELKNPQHMTEDEKAELKTRLKRILRNLSRNDKFRNACNSLFNIFDLYLKPMAEDLKNKTTRPKDENFTSMWNESKALIEEFTSGKTLDDFMDKFWDLYNLYNDDFEMNAWWYEFKTFFRDCLQNPEMLEYDETYDRANDLFERGRRLFNSEKYQSKLRELVDEGKDLLNRIQNDEDVNRFNEDITKLARDLAFDTNGLPSFGQLSDSLMELRGVLRPLLLRYMEDVPLPAIEGTTEKYRYRIENVTFVGGNIVPDQLRFHLDTDSYLKLRDELAPNELFALLRVNIDNIDCTLKGVKFWLHKFKGGDWTDHGVFDMDMKGVSFEFVWKIRSVQGRPWRFYIENVECKINSLKFKIWEAKHKIYDRIMTTLFIMPIRKRMERALEEFLIDKLKFLNRQFNQLFYAPLAVEGRTRIKNAVNDTVQTAMDKLNLGTTTTKETRTTVDDRRTTTSL